MPASDGGNVSGADDTDRPEWLPNEYDPGAPLDERLSIAADMEGAIELHVRGDNGSVEIVGEPHHYNESARAIKLCAGGGLGTWSWEIVAPKKDWLDPYLEKVDPDQDIGAYEATKHHWLSDIDVRIYGVDAHRFADGDDGTTGTTSTGTEQEEP